MALLFYSKKVESDLRKIDSQVAKRISEKIQNLCLEPDVLKHARKLGGEFSGFYRFRVGDYRVVFLYTKNKDQETVFFQKIKHRKDVYK